MRYAMIVEYDGANYSGWQRQKKYSSVQEEIENALERLFNKQITITGSGRTDKGVHAEGQVAHFDVETDLTPFKMKGSLNYFLPDDIQIIEIKKVSDDFHAQYDAISKVYEYRAFVSRIKRPLKRKYYIQIVPPVDIDLIKECAKKIEGEHDFAAFSVFNNQEKQNTIRTVHRLDVLVDGEEVIFQIEGNGFLYKMVRSIVGTLIWIGKGKLPADTIEKMFETGLRELGGKTMLPNGLILKSVEYKEFRS